jgi:catechol 1,2-dioxygenase
VLNSPLPEEKAMIVENEQQLTEWVLGEMHRTPDPRTKELLTALVKHLHGFVREVRLTEREFQEAMKLITWLGQATTPSHNEVAVIAGSLGVSNLVAQLNNGLRGTRPTHANNLGPFWRAGAPRVENGGTLLRGAAPGPALFFKGWVKDMDGRPVEGVEVDVWHSSPAGLYENQDPSQPEMNLRGVLTTDRHGAFSFRSVKPAGYPVPIDGPAGVLLKAQKRHNMRPAHLHFLIYKPGWKTIASQICVPDDPHLETDSQFGVTRTLIGNFVRHDDKAPVPDVEPPWYSLEFTFEIEPGEARRPIPPITSKVAA